VTMASFPSACLKLGPIQERDTIAAIATPYGVGGIGIVRLSGPSVLAIARRLFTPKKDSLQLISHRFHYGEIIDPEKGIPTDEVLLVYMESPKTYTREDVVEIHCHGGYLILQKVLELVLREGARLAQPGEFTKRAFLNGRIDLTQAEAVVDIIHAQTTESLEIAHQQLRGRLRKELEGIRDQLVGWMAVLEAHIDFPEEELDPVSREGIEKGLREAMTELRGWIDSYEEGKILREGVSCAIVGKTNVGKSSLLNVLLREERAIVTPVPGTTRDVIEEVLNIFGISVRLMDTAGLRQGGDSVEIEGVRRTRERVADADLVLLVLDGSRELERDDRAIFEEVRGKNKIIVINKRDLPERISLGEVQERFPEASLVSISALHQTGLGELKEAVHTSLLHGRVRFSPDHLIVANVRHKNALVSTRESLQRAREGIEQGTSFEFTAFELQYALEALGEIVGETTTEEVLDRIFEQFCVGK